MSLEKWTIIITGPLDPHFNIPSWIGWLTAAWFVCSVYVISWGFKQLEQETEALAFE